MRIALPVLLLLCVGVGNTASQTAKEKIQTTPVAKKKTPGFMAIEKLSPCGWLKCTSGATTRWAIIPIVDGAFLAPTPSRICACVGDTIEWTYANGSHTKDKDVYIEDVKPFLDAGECKKSKKVKKDTLEKASCRVQGVMEGVYKYNIKGSHVIDPEVEVRGGIRPSPVPTPIH